MMNNLNKDGLFVINPLMLSEVSRIFLTYLLDNIGGDAVFCRTLKTEHRFLVELYAILEEESIEDHLILETNLEQLIDIPFDKIEDINYENVNKYLEEYCVDYLIESRSDGTYIDRNSKLYKLAEGVWDSGILDIDQTIKDCNEHMMPTNDPSDEKDCYLLDFIIEKNIKEDIINDLKQYAFNASDKGLDPATDRQIELIASEMHKGEFYPGCQEFPFDEDIPTLSYSEAQEIINDQLRCNEE